MDTSFGLTPAATHRGHKGVAELVDLQALELDLPGCRLPVGAAESRSPQWSAFLPCEHERVRGGPYVTLKVIVEFYDNPSRKRGGASERLVLGSPNMNRPLASTSVSMTTTLPLRRSTRRRRSPASSPNRNPP